MTNGVEKKKVANFERITASPEALAEYLNKHQSCVGCEHCANYNYSCYDALLYWLKQESKEEITKEK